MNPALQALVEYHQDQLLFWVNFFKFFIDLDFIDNIKLKGILWVVISYIFNILVLCNIILFIFNANILYNVNIIIIKNFAYIPFISNDFFIFQQYDISITGARFLT